MEIFTVLVLFVFPVAAVVIARRFPHVNAIIICYAAGILLGNTASELFDRKVVKFTVEAVVILALPMLLFSADFKRRLRNTGTMLKAYLLAVVSVIAASFLTFYLFEDVVQKALIIGMYSGVISGGTPNLNAIGIALNAGEELFVLLNGYDVILSGSYFFILISFARPLLTRVLIRSERPDPGVRRRSVKVLSAPDLSALKTRTGRVGAALAVGVLTMGAVIGLSFLIFGHIHNLFVIIASSTAGILLSFNKRIRDLPLTFETGDYLLLAFAFGMGYLVRFDKLMESDFSSFALCASVFGMTLAFHLMLSRLFKLDADHFIISSTAGVFGPPFIGPVAIATGNEKLIGPGVAVAVIGHASGTYLGILLYGLLS